MKINEQNFEMIREGILSCCKDIEKNIDNIIKNYKRKHCTGATITISVEPNMVPCYVENYEYVSESYIVKQLNKNKGEN
ncbi:MAG: hypothetical protein IKI95_02075 [Clostridia bacterium]|nr:hypothetical protein [Clostridia bacterium]